MSDSSLPPELADMFADDSVRLVATQMPSAAAMAALVDGAVELSKLNVTIDETEDLLKALKTRRVTLSQRTLPDLFDLVQTDRIGVPDAHADVVVSPRYYANIAADWDEERRERGFAALEAAGGGDLIRVVVEVSFGKDKINLARRLVESLKRWPHLGEAVVAVRKSVPWASLTAFVKSETEKKAPLPLSDLGATIGRECKIVKRKGKPNGR